MELEDKINRLKDCDFAGEVALTEAELRILAKLVHKDLIKTVPELHAPERLIVAAVNCAYFYMDGGGFWEPFCELLGIEHTTANTQAIGSRIERALIKFGFVAVEGFGPNRYVTPLRIQAGITKRDFTTFAEILRHGRETPGLHSLQAMPKNALASFIDHMHPVPTVFTSHLQDGRFGSRLLRDVARDLLCLQRNIISEEDLCHLPGYRPGFWQELLPYLGPTSPPNQGDAPLRGHQVAFVFEPSGCCGLRFEREGVNRGEYRLNGSRVQQSFVRFEDLEQFRTKFCVHAGDAALEVPGWNPSDQKPFAVFRLGGEFVPHGAPVPRGECYLLAWKGFEPPPNVQRLSDFEWCANIMELRFWQILVKDTTDLAALGYTHGTAGSDVALRWIEEASICFLGGADGRAVFAGTLPKLCVAGVQAIREKRWALCWSDGVTIMPLRIPDDLGNEVEVRVPAYAPCMGEVWVEPLGRQSLEADEGLEGARMRFCLLPSCRLEWPSTLCAEDDEPRVVFQSANEDVQCDFPECSLVDQGLDSSVWTVPTSMIWMHCELTAGDVAVRLAHRLHRARVEDETGQMLWVSRSALATNATMCIHGWPRTQVRLCFVTPGEELVGEVLLHQHFDDHGLVRVSCLALYDGLRSETDAVIGISLWNEAGWVRTHARIIDLAKLEQWLTARGRIPNPAWLTMLDEQTSGVLQSLARVINDPTHGAHEGWRNEVIKKLPAWFGEYASEIFACACALTPDTPIGEPWTPALNFLPASNQYRLVVEWAIHARDAIANWDDDRIADSGLLHEFDLLSWRSPCEAWEDYVRELQKKLVGRQTLLPMLEEWKAEVTAGARDGEPGEWRSQISRMTGGNALCSAFFHNLKSDGQLDETRRGSLVEAYQKARSVSAIAPAPSSIVTALAWMLQLLALHKYGPASARMELLPARCPKNLIPLLDSLQSNRTTLMRTEDIDAALVLLDRLPLPAEDCERIRSGLAKPTSASTRTTQ